MRSDFLIVGAGVAGLSCARQLVAAGAEVRLLERSRGVGGRCATRRVAGQPVDHGLTFLHGVSTQFRETIEEVDSKQLWGWPFRVTGAGTPCQPEAFGANAWRMAFAEGVNAFPRASSQGLDIERGARVVGLRPEGDGWTALGETGQAWSGGTLVLALPTGHALALLNGALPAEPELAATRALLGMLGTHPCVTVLAGYKDGTPGPDWDICYPESSALLQLAAHDSAKRPEAGATVMVYQALPCWSRGQLAASDAACTEGVLAEAARLWGAWAAGPEWTQVHRWEQARADLGMELSRPLAPRLSTGQRLGLVGEVFAPGGGVEAAWSSGRALARRLIDESSP